MEGRKRIPSESWNPGMNTLFAGFKRQMRIRISWLFYARRLLSSFASHTPSTKCLGMSQLCKKILEKLRSTAGAPSQSQGCIHSIPFGVWDGPRYHLWCLRSPNASGDKLSQSLSPYTVSKNDNIILRLEVYCRSEPAPLSFCLGRKPRSGW